MKLAYGAYNHEEDEVGIVIQYRSIWDLFHRRMGQIETWNIVGVKQAASQAALTAALVLLEDAYLADFKNVTLFDNDGVATKHKIISGDKFGGVQVAHYGYPKGPWDMHTEYGSGGDCKRVFHIVLTAETRFGPTEALYGFKERVTQYGTGGAIQKYMGSLTGTPVLQTIRASTPIRFVQEGYVIGRGEKPTAPTPLTALGTEMLEQRMVSEETPKDIRYVNGPELFQVNYRYVMERVTAPGAYSLYNPTLIQIPV